MLENSIIDAAAMAVVFVAVAIGALLWLTRPAAVVRPVAAKPTLDRAAVFLFDGSDLVDATAEAQAMLGDGPAAVDWAGLRQVLLPDFPGFPAGCDDVRTKGRVLVPGTAQTPLTEALCEWIDGITRVELRSSGPKPAPAPDSEAEIIRLAMDSAPYPVWRLDETGNVQWCNAAYAKLSDRLRGKSGTGPDPLFRLPPDLSEPGHKRISVAGPDGGKKLWFDVTIVARKESTLCYAMDINAIVDAEIAQRNFVQTLAKTFAQLSIGLAIFDRNRQLALFNPALIDLTSLPADFLSARPALLSFFDRLRDRNMMPEPKNYHSWRDRMTELVEAAAMGSYQETWTLPSGSVYSVSGRPHPDGAVAFLFEDITAEITLTRRFRSELELGQAVMDSLDDAVVVFTPDGTLAFSNEAYNRMWDVDPDGSFAQVTVVDATRCWQDRCAATPLLGEIRDFVDCRDNRADWSGEIRLRNGDMLDCAIRPIQNGSTMVRFRRRRDPLPNPQAMPVLTGRDA